MTVESSVEAFLDVALALGAFTVVWHGTMLALELRAHYGWRRRASPKHQSSSEG